MKHPITYTVSLRAAIMRWLFGGRRPLSQQFLLKGKRHLVQGFIGAGNRRIVSTLCGEFQFEASGLVLQTRRAPSCPACLDRERTGIQ